MSQSKDAPLRCSICGKTQDEVKKIIAGPTVYICDECVELCNDIITEEYEQGAYVFFDNRFFREDFANSWRQKVKTKFRFEYAFLEHEQPPAGS